MQHLYPYLPWLPWVEQHIELAPYCATSPKVEMASNVVIVVCYCRLCLYLNACNAIYQWKYGLNEILKIVKDLSWVTLV